MYRQAGKEAKACARISALRLRLRVEVNVYVRMFRFTPSSIASSTLIGEPESNKVQTGTVHDSSIYDSPTGKRSGRWGIIVTSRHKDGAGAKNCSLYRKQNVVDSDVSNPRSPGDLIDGYVYSPHSGAESQCNDESSTVLRQRRTDKTVTRRTSGLYSGDMHWAGQSQATPLRSSGTFSFSESARLCQSCGRFTNSISLYGSQESLSFCEYQTSADAYSTICSVFWKMSLSFHPFSAGPNSQSSDLVKFASLWPNSRGLACLLPEICASLQGSIEALCRIAIFADVVKLLSALIDLKLVSKLLNFCYYFDHLSLLIGFFTCLLRLNLKLKPNKAPDENLS